LCKIKIMKEYKNWQKEYLQNEIWKLTFGAAFQRASLYKNNVAEEEMKTCGFRIYTTFGHIQ